MTMKIESLVHAIAYINSASDPESEAYKLNNPLLLKSWARPGKHQVTEDGKRVFDSYLAGFKAATYDVKLKASGESRANIKADGTLRQLFACYELRSPEVLTALTEYLQRALGNNNISVNTPVSYFLE